MNKNRIVIIGGGAAGLAAAVTAAANAEVTVYEKNDRVGKKLLQTGNGRCNLLNVNADVGAYHSKDTEAVKRVIEALPVSRIMDFFEELGLLMRLEAEGRVYPHCNQAAAVLDVLRYSAAERGAVFKCGYTCIGIRKKSGCFELDFADGTKECADKVIIACGGKAAPKTGSDGSGYALAKHMGHKITPIYPALVPIRTEASFVRSLKGIRCKAGITLLKNGAAVKRESGEIQFTDYGVSGIAVMQLSRYMNNEEGYELKIDFTEQYSFEHIVYLLKEARKRPREVQELTLGIVPRRVGQQLIKKTVNISLSAPASELSDNDIKKIASAVKGFRLSAASTLSWDNAQVTVGGIPLSEICADTLESKLCRGLYFAGEILDCDGACGGYNLGWAWSSGIIAARAAADILQEGVCLE